MLKTLTTAAAASALSLAIAPSIAMAETELSLATIAPEGTPWYAFMEEWANNVAEASNGELKITIFPSAQLGNEWEVWTKVVRGRIDIGVFTGAVMAEKIPEISLMSTPFLFDSEETIYCVYDNELGDEFAAMLEEHAKFIAWAETGWANIYAQDDLSDVADAEGYKTRVAPHAMSRLLWSSAGANGVEVPYADTPAALQTGLVRSGESTAIAYVAFGLTEVAPHYMLTRHMHQAGSILMSNKAWGQLSAEEQQIMMDSVPDVNGLRAGLNGLDQFMLGRYAEAGGPVHEFAGLVLFNTGF